MGNSIFVFPQVEKLAQEGDTEWQMELVRYYDEQARKARKRIDNDSLEIEKEDDSTDEEDKFRALLTPWLEKAGKAGNAEAQYRLYELFRIDDDEILERAAAGGYYKALIKMGDYESALSVCRNVIEKRETLFLWGKNLFLSGKTKAEKEKAYELLRQGSALGYYEGNNEFSNTLEENFANSELQFSYTYFDFYRHIRYWNPRFKSASEELFNREKAKYKKMLELSKAVLTGFFALYKEKYASELCDFEIALQFLNLCYAKVLIKAGKNICSIVLSADSEKWRSTLPAFLDVFTDGTKTPTEISATATKNGIEWAEVISIYKRITVKGDEAIFFGTGEFNIAVVSNLGDMRRIELAGSITHFSLGLYNNQPLSSLEEISLPKHIYSELDSQAFRNSRLFELDFPGFNIHDGFSFSADGKTIIAHTDNTQKSVVIPESAEKIGSDAFEYSDVKGVFIGSNITEIGERAFVDCKQLICVELLASLKEISTACFSGCSALRSISIPDGVKEIGYNAFRESAIEKITIPDSVTKIEDNAFKDCENLTEVHIGSGVKKLTIKLFSGCKKLQRVTGGELLEIIENDAFKGCSSLTEFKMPPKLRYIGANAFNDCALITEMSLPASIKYIGNGALPPALTHLHFYGTDKQWSYLAIGNDYNRELIKVLSTAETGILQPKRTEQP